MSQLDNVSVATTGNVYFDGRCVSFTVHTADGARKTVGVIQPSSLTFTTGAPEVIDVQKGRCRVRLPGTDEWQERIAGQQFSVGPDSSFDIEVLEELHYLCHFG
jgi:uncharacterized protein YaiE (UPF0345 family)